MDEITQPTPAPRAGKHRSVMLGALLGAVALAGTIVGVSTVAGAQDAPTPTAEATTLAGDDIDAFDDYDDYDEGAWAPFEACMTEQLGDLSEPDMHVEPTEEEFARFEAADDACFSLLPEDVKEDVAAWAPFEQCIDAQLGDVAEHDFTSEPTDEEWAAMDAAWEAADGACAGLLPEDAQIEMAAFEAFDQCLADAGVLDEGFGPAVHVETGSGFQVAEFGDVEGSITITGDSNGVVVSTSGGVTLLDEADLDAEWEAFDAAHSGCESLLPEDVLFED